MVNIDGKMSQNEKKMKKYIIERCNIEHFWFGTKKTFGYVPLLRDHLSCKTTFVWQKG